MKRIAIKNYLVNELDSYQSFAVIRAFSNDTIKDRVSLAVKENYSLQTVVTEIINDRGNTMLLSCQCTDEDGEIDTKEIELSLVAIYE